MRGCQGEDTYVGVNVYRSNCTRGREGKGACDRCGIYVVVTQSQVIRDENCNIGGNLGRELLPGTNPVYILNGTILNFAIK
uniref:Right handed beta helix domain-containing protein n=1 Tax=Setaria digitata TaxID=48799 RepID=A0A915PDH5_9BILA